jgi:hypothetical protein
LVMPGVPQFREPVTQNDQRPLALVRNMHLNSVCFDEPVISRCHNYPIQPQTY